MSDNEGSRDHMAGGPRWLCSNPSCLSRQQSTPRAGSLQRRQGGGFDEYHGRGQHRADGGIAFDDSQGKHSHTVRDKDFKPVFERKEGEG